MGLGVQAELVEQVLYVNLVVLAELVLREVLVGLG